MGMREQLEEAQNEINIMQQLHHPNLMPLLDSAVVGTPMHGSTGAHTAVLLLMPLYSGGNLFDAVQAAMPTGGLPLPEVLSIFVQVQR